MKLTIPSSQVLPYINVELHRESLNTSLALLKQKKATIPTAPVASWIPPDAFADSPLGSKASLLIGARINFRNAVRDSDASQTPLQFVYEPANCRLFYTIDDMYDMTALWGRVYNATWGGAPCVSGSTTNSAGTIPTLATDTVAYSESANLQIQLPAQPGLVAIGSGPGTGENSGVATFENSFKGDSGSGGKKKSAGLRLSMRLGWLVYVGFVTLCVVF